MHSTYKVDPFIVGLQFSTMSVELAIMVIDSVYYGSSFCKTRVNLNFSEKW